MMTLIGGLGNQMFQYAAGRSLALTTGQDLVLDRRHYRRAREHGYAMDVFELADRPVPDAEMPPFPRERPLAHMLWRLARRGPARLREAGPGYDPRVAQVTGPVWLEGYFQSERYFAKHRSVIRDELTVKMPPDPENARWLSRIKDEPRAVSLHVRRGDYVQNAKFAALHGTCTPAYYTAALDHVAAQMGEEPVVFAFSDDPAWVSENLVLPAEIRVVGHNGPDRNYEDLRLMSSCRHHIIANSSFSWWGAWLNPNPEKIVAAPERWFANPEFENPDIWPTSWIKIPG
ncbi:alpha-1,2-fucosyltransferase [Roseicyclus mahoneyensis]|nr:alpha-1,2-fucosyltransferase [Roseicyclus mahoneyensis]